MKQLPSWARWLFCLFFAYLPLSLAACQGRGRVHEAPPASYPDGAPPPSSWDEPAPSDPNSSPPGGYALPPEEGAPAGSALSSKDGEQPALPAPSSSPMDSAEAPSGAARKAEAKAEGAGALGRDSWDEARAPSSSWNEGRQRPLSPRPEPERRPGLATHWGETRYSPVRQVDFERHDAARPSATVELHYNDRAGARRMLPNGSWGRAEWYALGAVRLRIVDSGGRTFPALTNGSRVVAVGAPGERYALQIDNPSGQRLEVVASVDGLDVLDGEDASFAKRGYLVDAYSSVTIDGFRRSDTDVAAFRLGDVARSYAARQGKARNVGVIGFALFEERRAVVETPSVWWRPAPLDDTAQRRSADPFPGRYARPPVW